MRIPPLALISALVAGIVPATIEAQGACVDLAHQGTGVGRTLRVVRCEDKAGVPYQRGNYEWISFTTVDVQDMTAGCGVAGAR